MRLEQRLENHWLACMAAAGGGGRVTRLEGAVVVANPRVGGTSLNFATLRAASPERLPITLDMAGGLLAGYGRPPAVFLSPLAGEEPALKAVLEASGWRRALVQSVLAVPLPLAAVPSISEAVQVKEIGQAQLPLWQRTLVNAYEVAPPAGAQVRAAWSSLLRQPGEGAQARYYLAFCEGKPVATGLSWSQGEIGGLYCGAVLAPWRRQGIERATLLRRLNDLAAEGRHLATLQTDANSPVEHLCRDRFGFELVYRRELWLPKI